MDTFQKDTSFREETLKEEVLRKIINEDALQWFEEKSISYRRLMAYYRCAIMEIETKFNVLNEEFSLQYDRNPIASIKSRLKNFTSIQEKLKKNQLPLTLDSIETNLNDVAGVRVICSFPDDVYMLASALFKQDDITLVTKKDYIQNPKENGYRSLHLIVEVPIFLAYNKRIMKVEIQLRTIAMDFWASLEHQLKYKKKVECSDYLTEELRQCAEISSQLDLRMDEIRKNLEEGCGSLKDLETVRLRGITNA